jgi:hypothetical protein
MIIAYMADLNIAAISFQIWSYGIEGSFNFPG